MRLGDPEPTEHLMPAPNVIEPLPSALIVATPVTSPLELVVDGVMVPVFVTVGRPRRHAAAARSLATS